MEKFKEGSICYHKATGKRCVVITVNDNDQTIKVRTEDDDEKDYYPQELKTNYEIEAENRAFTTSLPNDSGLQF